jgi:hypothetical protein
LVVGDWLLVKKDMTHLVLKSKVSSEGVLHLELPMELADRQVTVTIDDSLTRQTMSKEEWSEWVRSMAGSWKGDFKRPT